MKRRKTALHAVVDGERLYDVPLYSHEHQLVGRLDEMVVADDRLYLIDYKDTVKDYGYWRVQMAAYQTCVREADDRPIADCFIYSIPQKRYESVKTTRRDMNKLLALLDSLRRMIADEVCPPPTAQSGKCVSCQYRRFCNDVS